MPRSRPHTWVTSADYPSASLRSEAEGTTRVNLIVGAHGRVENCGVTASSGHHSLDSATCRNLVRRGRFYPAQDSQGLPRRGSYSTSVAWRIPGSNFVNESFPTGPKPYSYTMFSLDMVDYPEKAEKEKRQGRAVVETHVNELGDVTSCSVIDSSGHADLDKTSCEFARENWHFRPARDIDGNAIAGKVRRSFRWRLPRPPVVSAPARRTTRPSFRTEHFPRPPYMSGFFPWRQLTKADYPAKALAEKREGETLVVMTVTPEGNWGSCEVTSSSGHKDLDAAACPLIKSKARIRAATGLDGKPGPGRIESGVNWRIPHQAEAADIPNVTATPAPPNVARPRTPNFFAEPGTANLELIMNKDGRIRDCELDHDFKKGEAARMLGLANVSFCREIEKGRDRFVPFKDADGNAIEKKIKLQLELKTEDFAADAGEKPE